MFKPLRTSKGRLDFEAERSFRLRFVEEFFDSFIVGKEKIPLVSWNIKHKFDEVLAKT